MNNYGIGGNEVKQDANEAFADIPQNRTLIIEKLTQDAPVKPEVVKGLKTVDDVFEHYKPNVEVEYEDSEGGSVKEKLNFGGLGDFGTKGITNQSNFLGNLSNEKEQYQKIIKQLKSNKTLKTALADPSAKESILNAIQSLIQELDKSK